MFEVALIFILCGIEGSQGIGYTGCKVATKEKKFRKIIKK